MGSAKLWLFCTIDSLECDEKVRLLNGYRLGAQEFLTSITELQNRLGTVPKREYERLRRVTETNRMKSEQARLELERHLADHGC